MSKPINKTGNLASATVIRRASGQVSLIFKNINEEQLSKLVSKYGAALERKYGIRFSARDSDFAVMVPFADYILVRPLSANGRTATSVREISVGDAGAVKEAVKELVTIYNKESQTDNKTVTPVMRSQDDYINEALRQLSFVANLSDEMVESFKRQINDKTLLLFGTRATDIAISRANTVIQADLTEGTAMFVKSRYINYGSLQDRVIKAVASVCNLLPAQSLAVKQLIEGFKVKQQFEDGVYYVHSSGKYRYLGCRQPNGKVLIFNITKGMTPSSLNSDPHDALTKGIVKKEAVPSF